MLTDISILVNKVFFFAEIIFKNSCTQSLGYCYYNNDDALVFLAQRQQNNKNKLAGNNIGISD